MECILHLSYDFTFVRSPCVRIGTRENKCFLSAKVKMLRCIIVCLNETLSSKCLMVASVSKSAQ